jgi:N-acetylglucosamine kinase-like BadF-type ATPase
MDYIEAALTVLGEEKMALHWTVIQDLALKRGYLDPFVQRDIRNNLLAALAGAAREGVVVKEGTGVYALPSGRPS